MGPRPPQLHGVWEAKGSPVCLQTSGHRPLTPSLPVTLPVSTPRKASLPGGCPETPNAHPHPIRCAAPTSRSRPSQAVLPDSGHSAAQSHRPCTGSVHCGQGHGIACSSKHLHGTLSQTSFTFGNGQGRDGAMPKSHRRETHLQGISPSLKQVTLYQLLYYSGFHVG